MILFVINLKNRNIPFTILYLSVYQIN